MLYTELYGIGTYIRTTECCGFCPLVPSMVFRGTEARVGRKGDGGW